MHFKITSPAFETNQAIPAKYTCDGDDLSPALGWSGVPQKTKSFVLIVDDPDAPKGVFTHWILANIPATVHELVEGFSPNDLKAQGVVVGTNSFGTKRYGGPCPPSGSHHYHFKLYALDTILTVDDGISKEKLLTALSGHILAQAELVGTYQRKQ